jgi:acetyl-CoA acetyltransferase
MAQLKPAFSKTGTITAANASKLNDAGCVLSIYYYIFAINLHYFFNYIFQNSFNE